MKRFLGVLSLVGACSLLSGGVIVTVECNGAPVSSCSNGTGFSANATTTHTLSGFGTSTLNGSVGADAGGTGLLGSGSISSQANISLIVEAYTLGPARPGLLFYTTNCDGNGHSSASGSITGLPNWTLLPAGLCKDAGSGTQAITLGGPLHIDLHASASGGCSGTSQFICFGGSGNASFDITILDTSGGQVQILNLPEPGTLGFAALALLALAGWRTRATRN